MSGYKIGIVEWAFPFPGPYGLKIASERGLQGMELDFGEYETGFSLSVPGYRMPIWSAANALAWNSRLLPSTH